MKKIGILFGMEETFPKAFVERVNSKKIKGIEAEYVQIDKVVQGATSDYAVIIDRISQDVPFYRGMLKNAAVSGTAVINNPFWWSADEKFFNNALMTKIDVPVPKTVLLPSSARPDETTERSFRNLKFPFDWASIFDYIGFPAYMKPFAGGGWKSVYKVHNAEDFFVKHGETGQLVMMLQEEIVFDEYYRCYCIGGKYVKIMPYEPRNPHHLRYVADFKPSASKLKEMEEIVLKINHALGYDFNTVELALRDGVPYAIDFCNPAPDAEASSVGEENFEWVVEHAAKYAIERAQAHKAGEDNLTWGDFVRSGANKQALSAAAPAKTVAKKAPTKKAPAKTTAKAPAKTTAKAPAKTAAKAPVKTAAKAPTAKATATKNPAAKKPEAKAPLKGPVTKTAPKAPATKTAEKAPAAKKTSTRKPTTKKTSDK